MIFSSLLNDACPDSVWASPVNGVYSERSRTGVKFLFSFSAISARPVSSRLNPFSLFLYIIISFSLYFIRSLTLSSPRQTTVPLPSSSR